MATYYVNEENTGLDSEDRVIVMADLMRADGHDVEFTENYGLVNREECPVNEEEWMAYLEAADQAFEEE